MEDILNFHQVSDRIGTSGQPTADQFSKIQVAGYSTIINLAMSDASNAVPEEEKLINALGMTYIHLPVPFDNPGINHLRAFLALMDALKPEKVFVHCALNLRVSAFMYQYLILREGRSAAHASSPYLQAWWPKMDARWRSIVQLQPHEIAAPEITASAITE